MSEKNSRLFRQVLGLKDETEQGYKRIQQGVRKIVRVSPDGTSVTVEAPVVQIVCTGKRADYKRLKRVLRDMKRSNPQEYAATLAAMREQVYGENTSL